MHPIVGLGTFTHTCLFAQADRSENMMRANIRLQAPGPKPHTRQAQSTKLQAPSLPALTAVRQAPCSMPTCPVASILFSGKQGYSNSALLPKNTPPPAPCFEPMTPEGSHVYRKKWQIEFATPEWVEPPVGLRTLACLPVCLNAADRQADRQARAPLSFWRVSPDLSACLPE